MNSKLLLRIAAGSIFVHLLGHTMGHLTWKTPEDNQIKEVVTQMLTHKATFMGATRSMGDYFEGYSLILFFVYGMSIALLWLISGLTAENPAIAKRLIWPIGISYVAFGIIEYIHFFTFAAVMSGLAGILALSAIGLLNRRG